MVLDMLRGAKLKTERSARKLLLGTPLFFPLRSAYQGLFDREKQVFRRRMCDFYRQFVRKGDLVFDVGANLGMYSEIFTQVGATVVAIEPNPKCCERLKKLARVRRIMVENCAAGDCAGVATLRLCEESPLSTLSDSWYEEVSKLPLHRHARWIGKLQVPVKTLDSLAERYGVPRFVKIDVEGYEEPVLRGMSFRPEAFSVEFNFVITEVALRCLEMPIFSDRYDLNYVKDMNLRFESDRWMDNRELMSQLLGLQCDEEYGEVFARRIG